MNGLDLKVLRIRSGLRQYELAARLGLSPSHLSLVENGRRPLEPGLAQQAVTALTAGNTNAATRGERGDKRRR